EQLVLVGDEHALAVMHRLGRVATGESFDDFDRCHGLCLTSLVSRIGVMGSTSTIPVEVDTGQASDFAGYELRRFSSPLRRWSGNLQPLDGHVGEHRHRSW